MEVIDGVIVFSKPSPFFKWLWNYEGKLRIAKDGNVYEKKILKAKLEFFKRK